MLVHTSASDKEERAAFDPAYASFTPQAAERLGTAGARLIGTDAPSVDSADSLELAAHKAFHRAGITIIENLPPAQRTGRRVSAHRGCR